MSSGTSDDADGGETLRLSVPEMDCPTCAGKVEASLDRLDGVLAMDPRPASGTLVVRYDPDRVTVEDVRERIEGAGYAVVRDETLTLDVPEMDCPDCAGKVEGSLSTVDGVLEYDTRPAAGTAVVTYDTESASRESVVAAIEGAGYRVETGDEVESPGAVWTSPRALKTWAGALSLAAGLLVEWVVPGLNADLLGVAGVTVSVDSLFYVLAVVVAGQEIVRSGYYSARNRNLDIDFLMTVGIAGALAVDLPFEAATLAVLYSVAELMERFSMDRARNSLRELMELSPDTATVLRDGEESVVPVDDVAVGERVVVRPGEKVPLDGEVREGASAVDESPITGESVPVDRSAGDEVYAGSIVAEGYLEVEATAPAGESTLSQVIRMVADAESNRSEREQFIDRFADYYTPLVVVAAVLTVAVPTLLFGEPLVRWFTRGLTLLVVACPCAFVISTPVSVVSGITSAARNGVLIKGGDRLEAMADVDAVAFDKTGTLTTGDLGVTDVVPLNGNDVGDVLACARAVESRSEHPISAAIVAHADERGVPEREVSDFEALPGRGVRADVEGTTHYAGSPDLFSALGFDLEHAHVRTDGGLATGEATDVTDAATECEHGTYYDLVNEVLPRLQEAGKTAVLVGTEDELEGVVAIADTVRPEAAWVVSRLRELGVDRIAMVTGDNERTARAIADRVGIDEVHAEVLPEQKVAVVERLGEASETVVMVGDGVNDAPALATATVGVAMGAAGTDTALETADVALMADDLSRLPYLFDLSSRATRVIRQNVWASLAVKAVLAVGAPLGLVSVIHAIVVGDMGMSLTVTGNAMRLAGVTPEEFEGE
ncbi:MAG: heavy metal translocating P-type ATPase [Haloferacaceae archaeon]